MTIDASRAMRSASGAGAALPEDGSLTGALTRRAVDLLGTGAAAGAAELFVPAFLDRLPAGLASTVDQWRSLGPFTVESYTRIAHKSWVLLRGRSGSRHSLTLTADSTGLIRGLDLRPEVVVPELGGWADLGDAVAGPGITGTVLATRFAEGGWSPVYDRDADRLMPSASLYKLYVLRALVYAIAAGGVGWDDRVTVRPLLRSLPTGELQDRPDGTAVTVHEAAHLMFAMSDNTASDMIMDLLGRDAVERAVARTGHRQPSVLRPFPSSREVFQIGWGDPALLRSWADGDEAERRQVLRTIEHPLSIGIRNMSRPAHARGADWFMCARDVADALLQLWRDAGHDPTGTVRDILTANPGIIVDGNRWPAVIFKGGACPGVMVFCWLLEDPHGTPHVLVLQQSADDNALVGDGQLLRGLGEQAVNSLPWEPVASRAAHR